MVLTGPDPQRCQSPLPDARSPGEVLLQDYMHPGGYNARQLARRAHIPARHIVEMALGKRRVTPEIALRLAEALDTGALYWMLLQAHHDLRQAQRAPSTAR